MRPELFTIQRSGPGTLSTMASPRGLGWLGDDMRGLAAAGVGVLVSLLTDDEMAELGLTAQAETARSAGLEFHRLPTPDRHVPDRGLGLALADRLKAHLKLGTGVAIHCRYGIGRSSTLAAMVMVAEGTQPEQALALISAARGMPVPDTGAQRESVLGLRVPVQEEAGPEEVGRGEARPEEGRGGRLLQDCPDAADS
jgi:protein-tyrosine phosphatase